MTTLEGHTRAVTACVVLEQAQPGEDHEDRELEDDPIHPVLAALLGEWRLFGWSAMFGRQPGPDDLIVPLPPADARRRTKRRDAEPFRGDVYTRK